MTNNGAAQERPMQQPEQRDITKEDVQNQQRANLALRSLDLEAENVLLQQENAKLKARIEELESMPPAKNRSHPIPSISDA
jgi:cell division protein FtsB